MDSNIDKNDLHLFHELLKSDRETHAGLIRRMDIELVVRYIEYLRSLRSMSVEEYEVILGRRLTPKERELF